MEEAERIKKEHGSVLTVNRLPTTKSSSIVGVATRGPRDLPRGADLRDSPRPCRRDLELIKDRI